MSTWSVLAIAGVAAIGVPMNALFFQDGSHPAPIFAGQPPLKPVEAAGLDAQEAEPTKPASTRTDSARTDTIPTRAPAPSKRGDLAGDELAALAAEPSLKAPRAATKPEAAKPAASKPATDKPVAKPAKAPVKADAAGKPDAPKAATKPPAKSAAATPKPPVKPAAAKAEAQPEAKSTAAHSQRPSVSDLIGHLLGAAR